MFKILCHSPAYSLGSDPVVSVEVAENGVDFTEDGVAFRYRDVPFLGSWHVWELVLVIAGSVGGAATLIIIVAVCLYRKARYEIPFDAFVLLDADFSFFCKGLGIFLDAMLIQRRRKK